MKEYYKSLETFDEPLNEMDPNTAYSLLTIGLCGAGWLFFKGLEKAAEWLENKDERDLWKQIEKKEKVLKPIIDKFKNDRKLELLLQKLDWVVEPRSRNEVLEKIGLYLRNKLSNEELAKFKGIKQK